MPWPSVGVPSIDRLACLMSKLRLLDRMPNRWGCFYWSKPWKRRRAERKTTTIINESRKALNVVCSLGREWPLLFTAAC
ncbi:Hybrid PKS-NRPS synthetase apdA [Trichinella spiralis]|uniref:Hybrid PKS-NRPS synthetase apdA n=1 Tax=Trichinella spiralis TaxID=6334 RepID=A0ABR3K763_TRISP